MGRQDKIVVRSTGLTEALWSCVLDDYLSEDEEGEFQRYIGSNESIPWYLRPDTLPCHAEPKGGPRFQIDPRDVRLRGNPSSAEERSGDTDKSEIINIQRDHQPARDLDETAGSSELPPLAWLAVPQQVEANDQEPDLDSSDDWDVDAKPHQSIVGTQEKGGRRWSFGGARAMLRIASPRSKVISKQSSAVSLEVNLSPKTKTRCRSNSKIQRTPYHSKTEQRNRKYTESRNKGNSPRGDIRVESLRHDVSDSSETKIYGKGGCKRSKRTINIEREDGESSTFKGSPACRSGMNLVKASPSLMEGISQKKGRRHAEKEELFTL